LSWLWSDTRADDSSSGCNRADRLRFFVILAVDFSTCKNYEDSTGFDVGCWADETGSKTLAKSML
jgi:hypothetical protein